MVGRVPLFGLVTPAILPNSVSAPEVKPLSESEEVMNIILSPELALRRMGVNGNVPGGRGVSATGESASLL